MTGINLEAFMISILTSSIFILLIVIFRAVFRRKISMRLQYALWLLVAVNLLMIPIPKMESILSVQNLVSFDKHSQTSQRVIEQERNTTDITFLTQQTAPKINQNKEQVSETRKSTQTQETSKEAKRSLSNLAVMIAVGGSVLMLLYVIFYHLRFNRFLHRQRMGFEGYSSKLPIYLVEGLPSPCLYGKAIYITPEVTTNEKKLKHVITHEYCHYRQGDLWWSALRSICLICYWWNPLVWLAAYLSKQDCELACDEAAIRQLGDAERIPYGETLIGLITVKTKPQDYLSIATTMTGSGKSMKQRIQRIAGKQKAVISVCIILVLLVGICFVSVSTVKKEDREKQESNVENTLTIDNTVQEVEIQTDELTMDRVIAMFKTGSLGEADYFSFSNAKVANKEKAKEYGWLNYYVDFHLEYKGEGYHLGASHSVEDDTLLNLYLTRDSDMESRLIYTTDDKYIVVEDIEEYLNNKVQISDLLSIELPEGYTLGNYMANIGIDGGAFIEPQAYEVKGEDGYGSGIPEWFYSGAISIIRYPQDWFVFEDEKLVDKQMHYWNHTSEEKIEELDGLAMPAILYRANHDLYTASESAELMEQGIELKEDELTSDYWYIYFASPESEIAYYLSLDARQFSKEQAIEIAKSVRFADITEYGEVEAKSVQNFSENGEEAQILEDFGKIEELHAWFFGFHEIGRKSDESVKKERNGYPYFPVEQYEIHTIKELQDYVKQYTTTEQSQTLFVEHEPEIFFEEEGVLYTLSGYIGNFDYQDGERRYEVIYDETEQKAILKVTLLMETLDNEIQEVTMEYQMFRAENGHWKIEGAFELPIKVFIQNTNNL